jgi:hypothetical protein
MRYSFLLNAVEDRGKRGPLSAYPDRSSANLSSPQPRAYLQPFNFRCPAGNTSLAVSYSCKLFVVAKKLNCFAIKQIQTLLTKHPEWGRLRATCETSRTLLLPVRQAGLSVVIFRRICTILVHPINTFRINTCKSASKQTTSTPFRMNTYAKPGEGGDYC